MLTDICSLFLCFFVIHLAKLQISKLQIFELQSAKLHFAKFERVLANVIQLLLVSLLLQQRQHFGGMCLRRLVIQLPLLRPTEQKVNKMKGEREEEGGEDKRRGEKGAERVRGLRSSESRGERWRVAGCEGKSEVD